MKRERIKRKLLWKKSQTLTLVDVSQLKQEITQLQWESFFRAIQIMINYREGLITKQEYVDFREGKIYYPLMQPREVRRDAETTPSRRL